MSVIAFTALVQFAPIGLDGRLEPGVDVRSWKEKGQGIARIHAFCYRGCASPGAFVKWIIGYLPVSYSYGGVKFLKGGARYQWRRGNG